MTFKKMREIFHKTDFFSWPNRFFPKANNIVIPHRNPLLWNHAIPKEIKIPNECIACGEKNLIHLGNIHHQTKMERLERESKIS